MPTQPVRRVGPPQLLVEMTTEGPNGLHEVSVVDLRVGSMGNTDLFPDGPGTTGTDGGGGGGTEPAPEPTPEPLPPPTDAAPLGSIVQTGNGTLSETVRSGTVSLPTIPKPGSLVYTAIVTDKQAATFTTPSGHTALPAPLPYLAASVSGHASYKVVSSTPTDSDRHASWAYTNGATVGRGARMLIVEIGSGGGAFAHAASTVSGSETAGTTRTVDPGASTTANEIAVALAGIDSSDNGQWLAGDPQWSGGYSVALTAGGNTVGGSPVYNGGAGGSIAVKNLGASGTSAAATATWAASDQNFLAASRFSVGGTPATGGGLVTYRAQGAITTTSVTVAAKVTGTTSARLKVGNFYSGTRTPDANGWVKLTTTGLTAGTTYTAYLELNGVLDTSKPLTVKTVPSAPASFLVAFGSCDNSTTSPVYARMQARNPNMVAILGDVPYVDISTDNPSGIRSAWENTYSNSGRVALRAAIPEVRTWSDHDFGANNSYSSSASKPAVQAVYRQIEPHYPLPSTTGGIYHSYTWGRLVRGIVTDTRSYKSNPANTDNSTKTMLGAEQKAWFKDQISKATEDLIIWHMETIWVTNNTGEEWWGAYQTERTELINHIQAAGKNVVITSGDMHALAANDGSSSPGGIPVFQAAPISQGVSSKGGPYTSGPTPTSGSATQYGTLNVTKSGTTLTAVFTGYNSSDAVAFTVTKTYTVEAGTDPGPGPGSGTTTGSYRVKIGAVTYAVADRVRFINGVRSLANRRGTDTIGTDPGGTEPQPGTDTGGTTDTGVGSGTLPAGESPDITRRMVGIDNTVTARVLRASQARLRIGTDSAVTTNIKYGPYATPNARGNVRMDFGTLSLIPGTYYYRVQAIGTDGEPYLDTSSTVGRIVVWPSSAHSFSFIPISCDKDADRRSWASMARRNPDLVIHMGDQLYADDTGLTEDNFFTRYNSRYSNSTVQSVLARARYSVTPSDHDHMYNNYYGLDGAKGADARRLYHLVHNEIMPTLPTPGAVSNGLGVGHTFVRGRVRFIVGDQRTYMTDPAGTDNSSKSKLGSTQKAWIKNLLATVTEPVIFYVSDTVWVQPTASGPGDGWGHYNTERQEIVTAMVNSGKSVFVLSGDSHFIAYQDSSTVGGTGIPNFTSSPVGNTATEPMAGVWDSVYPASGGSLVFQYGVVDVVDTGGTSIDVTFKGYTASTTDTERMTFTKTVTVTAAAVTAPGAPTDVSASTGNAQSTVSFTPPASSGGASITNYRVTSTPGAITATGSGSPITVTGLANGTAYTFTVAAQNSVGYGPESAASNSVTPTSSTAGSAMWQPFTSSPLNTSSPTVNAAITRLFFESGNSQWARQDWGAVGTNMQESIEVDLRWDKLDTTTSRWAGIAFGCDTTPFHDGNSASAAPANGAQGIGYLVRVRQNGGMNMSRWDTSGVSGPLLGEVAAGTLPAVTVGTVERIKVGRYPTGHLKAGQVYATRTRVDGGATVTIESAAADTTHNGNNWNLGKFGSDGIWVSYANAVVNGATAATPPPAITHANFNNPSLDANAATSASIAPTTTTAGRLVLAAVGIDKDAGTITNEPTWTQVVNYTSASISTVCAFRVATGDANDTYNPTWTTSREWTAIAASFNLGSPALAQGPIVASGSGTSVTSLSVSGTASAAGLAVAVAAIDTSTGADPEPWNVAGGWPQTTSGWTQLISNRTPASPPGVAIFYKPVAAGDSLALTMTQNAADETYLSVSVLSGTAI